MSSNEYLTRVNLMDASNPDTDTPIHLAKNVMVVGGGNTAMDSCRTAKRLGAERVMIVYRRSEAEMPARLEEVKHAKEEGIEFLTLHNPLEYIADEKGAVKQVVLQKMQLGEPDASGRRSPEPIPGATETLDIDMAIVAVGVSPNPIVPTSIQGLELGRKNTIVVNEACRPTFPASLPEGISCAVVPPSSSPWATVVMQPAACMSICRNNLHHITYISPYGPCGSYG